MKITTISVLILAFVFGCTSEIKNKIESENQTQSRVHGKQLNITILLDLSDRISTTVHPSNPEHFERDIEIIKYISEIFVDDMKQRGTFMAKGKFKVLFSPKPKDPNINIIAEKLKVDLSKVDKSQKKYIHDNLTMDFSDNLKDIYEQTIAEEKWQGSDIWRFFKNDVTDYCITNDSNYRNILVILTDGYIYHVDSKDHLGNKYAYILPDLLERYGLRSNNWEENINKNSFGLITKRNDLQNLEVLVLEINPSKSFKNDEDVLKTIWSNWLKEMMVSRHAIYNSDLPEYTKERISSFIIQ